MGGGGTTRQRLVKFGIMLASGGVCSRGLSRRVMSCSSWLSMDTCLERLFICVRTETQDRSR